MGRLSTIYDDVGENEKQKVFVLRGDEAYARTTDTLLTVGSTFDETNPTYYTADFNVEILRALGNGQATLYCDDDSNILGTFTSTPSNRDEDFDDIKFGYGVDYEVYAKFWGNTQCLKSKSKKITLHRNIPATHKTNITITGSSQINHGADYSITVALAMGNTTTGSPLYNRDILLYVDGVYSTTITTGNNSNTATGTIEDIADGKHTITAEVPQSSSMNYGTATKDIMVGCHVEIIEYPTFIVSGQSKDVKVKVTDYADEPIASATVSFNSTTATTNSNGIATFSVTSIPSTGQTATCNGSESDPITITIVSAPTIEIICADYITASGYSEPVRIQLNGDEVADIPVTLSGGMTGTYTTNANGIIDTKYDGNASGDVSITASCLDTMTTAHITDCDFYLKAPNIHYIGNDDITLTDGEIRKLNSYYSIRYSDITRPIKVRFNMKTSSYTKNPYVLEFGVVKSMITSTSSFEVVLFNSNPISLNTSSWSVGDLIRLEYSSGSFKYYRNNSLVSSQTPANTDGARQYLQLKIPANSNTRVGNEALRLNNIKFYKL